MFGNMYKCKYSKGTGHRIIGPEGSEGELKLWLSYCFFKFGVVVNATPQSLYPGKDTGYPLYRRLGGPHGGVDGSRKSRAHRDSIPGPSTP